jgi:hypothetical protein
VFGSKYLPCVQFERETHIYPDLESYYFCVLRFVERKLHDPVSFASGFCATASEEP